MVSNSLNTLMNMRPVQAPASRPIQNKMAAAPQAPRAPQNRPPLSGGGGRINIMA